MKSRYSSFFQTTILTLVAIIVSANISIAQDKGTLVKILYYKQTSASAPTMQGAIFFGELNCYGASTVTNATLTPPGKSPVAMEPDWNSFQVGGQYFSQAALDTDFPNGNFIITTMGVNYTASIAVSLTGDTYPTTPQISNFTAAQSINPNQDFTLTWNNLGLTSNDFIKVGIYDSTGKNSIFETPPPMNPGALPGNLTSFTIPANTLCPGAQYDVNLIVAKIVNVVTNNNPDGTKTVLASAYAKFLDFPIKTTGTAISLAGWDKPNFVFFFPDGTIYGTNAVYSGTTIANYNMYFQVKDPSPTNSVLFTGPAGSGLNNTPSAWNNIGEWSSYGSPFLSIISPNQITGGVYTITYKGVSLKFNMPNPQISAKQVLLLPEFVVGSDGILKQLKWSYIASDGRRIPPQEFMETIGFSINAKMGGELFSNWGLRPAFTNYNISSYNIRWSDVDRIQIGFNDVDDNNFMTIYRVSSGPEPVRITTDVLSGTQGQSFSQMLNAIGSMYPYKWSIEYGFLPSGLILDGLSGTITGVPGEVGSFKVNVKVTDAMNQTATKDIRIQITPGTFTHRPAFTNMTVVNGVPSVTFLTMPGQFYTIEMSEDLKNWKVTGFFPAQSDRITEMVPPEILRSYNKMFFRLGLGHRFYSDVSIMFFANSGSINSNAPYNVTVNFPVSINSTKVTFCAGFDPDYADKSMVYFSNPIFMSAEGMESRFDENDPGTIGYYVLLTGVQPSGAYTVNYKSTNMTFNVSHQGNNNLVIPVPSFTVSGGQLKTISWIFKDRVSGTQYSQPPTFIHNFGIQIDDYNFTRIYNAEIEDFKTTNAHNINGSLNWSNVRLVYMTYEDTNGVLYVISFSK